MFSFWWVVGSILFLLLCFLLLAIPKGCGCLCVLILNNVLLFVANKVAAEPNAPPEIILYLPFYVEFLLLICLFVTDNVANRKGRKEGAKNAAMKDTDLDGYTMEGIDLDPHTDTKKIEKNIVSTDVVKGSTAAENTDNAETAADIIFGENSANNIFSEDSKRSSND